MQGIKQLLCMFPLVLYLNVALVLAVITILQDSCLLKTTFTCFYCKKNLTIMIVSKNTIRVKRQGLNRLEEFGKSNNQYNYICTSLCTISSLVIRCVVRFSSCIKLLRLCDHSLRISLDSLWAVKVTRPAGRSILANTVLDTTSSDRNSSVS